MSIVHAIEIPLIKATNDSLKGYGYLVDSYKESEIEIVITARSQKSPTTGSEKSTEGPKSGTPFGEFLDIMEVF